jgi:Fe-Mn family superoxide dismutase
MFTLPDLPYAYSALEPYIDEMTMHIHHDKHHATYVKNLNDALVGQDALLALPVEKLVADFSVVPEAIRTKVKNNSGGHANHSFFWTVMGAHGAGGQRPSGNIATAIDTTFGSFEKFQEQFSAAALNHFGSGWAWLVAENGQLTITDTSNQDTPVTDGKTPVLTIDVWEHAYYLKYQNMRVEYIRAWWNVVNWAEVSKRFQALA